MTNAETVTFFAENYKLIFSNLNNHDKKIFIGNKNNRTCRFCGGQKPEVTFRNNAHAIPEFLGNKRVLLLEECDACNGYFSEGIEDNLDKFTRPIRTIGLIKGKKKVPGYKTNDNKSKLAVNAQHGISIIEKTGSNKHIMSIDEDSRRLVITFKLEPYIPSAVYKCLAKIALSVMPNEELFFFRKAISWVRSENHAKIISPQVVIITFAPGRYTKPALIVLRRKHNNANVPYCILVIGFGNFVFQLIVPSDKDGISGQTIKLKMPRFPNPLETEEGSNKRQYGRVDLSSHEVVTGSIIPIQFEYEHLERTIM
ncbi:MAG: hypothetical protein M0R70_12365 [Nitrospirae bacterium]|nr:hypothetical protein [Nitrospirota bacterium]